MDRVPVSSSSMASIGYDPDTLTLEIEFRNGAVYQYASVSQGEYEGFISSASKGAYFNSYIKRYHCTRL
jgi:KTSC domain